jgi:tetratricopeptide (TPR) repeat protein
MKTIGQKISFILLALCLCGAGKLSAQTAAGETLLLTAEGQVEISRTGTTSWLAAHTNLVLQTGDRLRTGLRSRAVVRWANLSVLRVNELTTFVVQPPSAPGKTARLDVKSGSTYFFSRERPADVEFSTPLSSGAIRGTEFNLAVAESDGRSVVTLIDGALSISNSLGAVNLASGEEATVDPGQPPKKTAVINAVNVIQWCLYYPGVIDAGELGLSSGEQQTLAASLDAYRAGDLLAALANYPAGRTPSSDAEKIYFAQLLLAVGQVEQAETQLGSLSASSPLAGALREVVAAVKNQTWVRPAPATLAGEWLADSYYLQSHSKLDEALKAARKSVAQSPKFGFGWARVAELEFSFGRVPAANVALDQALKFSQRNAEAVSLKGFLLAAQNKNSAARKKFDEAIALDGALGNAWLGRGLVRIHAGDAAGGRSDLQVAVTVEPQRAALRSYLGKAFSNARDNGHAEKEFALAKKLDPNDPTVWLYSALLNERENKVNDAVGDLEKSQALNNNRSVYRSQLLLDQDRAVRGANLANIYRDAGMTDTGVREAVQAVNSDYANYSSHQFLADNYFNLLDRSGVNLRYETAFQTEYLVANLLAPVGAGTLSPQVSQQEYSKLFERDHVGVSSDTKYLSHGDWYQSAVEYGNFGNTAFAFEQDYSSTHGYRPNSGQKDMIYDFKLKQQFTPKDSAFVEVELRDTSGGNLIQYYNQATAASMPFRFTDKQKPIVVAGLHHEWSPGVDTLVLASRLDDTYSVADPLHLSYLSAKDVASGPITAFLPFTTTQKYRSSLEIYSAEAQQIWQTHQFTTIAGARWQVGEFDTQNNQNNITFQLSDFVPDVLARQKVAAKFNRENVYAYEYWQPLDVLRIIGGVSYDRLVIPQNFRSGPVNNRTVTGYHLLPKAGVIWMPLAGTTVRAGYSQSVGGASFDQSFQLEPSQVAGFNQAFRSLIPESLAGANAGATFTIYGVSLEQKLPTRTYLAVEGSLLKSKASRQDGAYEFNDLGGPFISSVAEKLDFTEWSVTGSAHQLLGRDWTLGAIYRLSHAELRDVFPGVSAAAVAAGYDIGGPNNFSRRSDSRGLLQVLDLQAGWQHPTGLFARLDAVWTHQDNRGDSASLAGADFWQVNLQVGKRFFHRHAELTAGVLNLTGQNYHLNPLNLYSETPRDRTFFTQFKFQF